MIASILDYAGLDPTVMNGGVITNMNSNMRVGQGAHFITETDESDGSIALYRPTYSIINNIALDHMPMDELKSLFVNYANATREAVIVNADNDYVRQIIPKIKAKVIP